MKFNFFIGKILLSIPRINSMQFVYKILGVQTDFVTNRYFIANPTVIGEYEKIYMHDGACINKGCLLLVRDRIEIGENSSLAYGVTILTSANPDNALNKIYPPKTAPVIIGKDCWIGANSTILPGVIIGDYCMVAAGSVVTKDVPSHSMVAGSPARIKKVLNIEKNI